MNILVTGGAGFIGSHFVLRHCDQYPSDSITVLDNMTYAANKNFLKPVMSKINFVEGDIANTKLVNSILEKDSIDVIVNFAAETHVDRSIKDAMPFIHSNISGVQSLVEACRAKPDTLLFHVSTDEVYGDQQDEDRDRIPDDALHPSSPYAASKASADLLVLAAVRTYGIRARISRCTNNYGPHQAEEKFLPTVIRSILLSQQIPIYGEGKNQRDWLYVGDHCDAIELLLQKGEDGKIYHVSANNERPNIEVARTVLEVLEKPESLISFVPDRPGHDWRYKLDSSNTRALGWKPKVSFEEGLTKTVSWYSERL